MSAATVTATDEAALGMANVGACSAPPLIRNREADIPAFLDRRNNANAAPSNEGRSG